MQSQDYRENESKHVLNHYNIDNALSYCIFMQYLLCYEQHL